MRISLISICFVLRLHACALAHPVSHTDAWVRISGDTVQVRLLVFLDDVVRHRSAHEVEQTQISATEMQQAIRQHSETLLKQLRIFDQQGTALVATVTALPRWKPRSDTVDLAADSNLKLKWTLEFAGGNSPITSLCFLHQFTHPTLTDPGELRLHLQHTESGRRIDAVIPPGRPHTVLLPTAPTPETESINPNAATSRIIVAPTGIVHEFTAPLILLDAAWPAASQRRQNAADPTSKVTTELTAATLEKSKQGIAKWFSTQTSLSVGGVTQTPVDLRVDFFPAEGPATTETSPASPTSRPPPLPLFGTQVGVQLRYPRSHNPHTGQLQFLSVPGVLTDLTLEFVTATQQSSELIPFATSSSDIRATPALTWTWNTTQPPSAQPASAQPAASQPKPDAANQIPVDISEPADLLLAHHQRPGLLGGGLALLTLIVCGGAAVSRRRRWSWKGQFRCCGLGLLLAAVAVLAFPQTQLEWQAAATKRVTEQLFSDVYHFAMQPDEQVAVTGLSQVLHVDLVETVYLQMLESLATSSDDGLLIDVQTVALESQQLQSPPETQTDLTTTCIWRVKGSIHHWGHLHSRELKLTAKVGLFRDGGRWKIRSLDQLETDVIRVEFSGVSS